jgi:protein-S-isoprenylcysteine O-methyltransferase Ste14
MTDLAMVAAVTALWSALHSFLLTTAVQDWLRRRLGEGFAFTRLAFNLVAVLSFGALTWWVHGPTSPTLWAWTGWWQVLRGLLLATGVMVTYLGAREFDQAHFVGLAQIANRRTDERPPAGRIARQGILAHIRHPYYAAAFLMLVGYDDFTSRNLGFRVALMFYLVIGTELEERKLLREHGTDYAMYRREVPRFWPRWRRARRPGDPQPTRDNGDTR